MQRLVIVLDPTGTFNEREENRTKEERKTNRKKQKNKNVSYPPEDAADNTKQAKETIPPQINRARLRTYGKTRQTKAQQDTKQKGH